MAISVPNTLNELKIMSDKMGLNIQGSKKDGSCSKEDYIIPIRERIICKKFGKTHPDRIDWLLEIKSPMLAKRYDEIPKDIQKSVWEDDNWTLEEKINGLRCILIKDYQGFHIYSRECDRKTLLPINITRSLVLKDTDFNRLRYSFVIDCEIITSDIDVCNELKRYGITCGEAVQALSSLLIETNPLLAKRIQVEHDFKISLVTFDCLRVDDTDLKNEPLSKRRVILSRVVSNLNTIGFPIRQVDSSKGDKRDFYSRCISHGLEGCIAKRRDGIYIPDTKRNKDGWIKLKPSGRRVRLDISSDLTDMESVLTDTVDAFITGFSIGEKGSVFDNKLKSIELSVIVKNGENTEKRKLCDISDIENNVRDRMITRLEDGSITLRPVLYNKVVEVDDICSHIIKFRSDKSSEECTMDEMTYNTIENMYVR